MKKRQSRDKGTIKHKTENEDKENLSKISCNTEN